MLGFRETTLGFVLNVVTVVLDTFGWLLTEDKLAKLLLKSDRDGTVTILSLGEDSAREDEHCDGALQFCGLVRVSASNDGFDITVESDVVVFEPSGTFGNVVVTEDSELVCVVRVVAEANVQEVKVVLGIT